MLSSLILLLCPVCAIHAREFFVTYHLHVSHSLSTLLPDWRQRGHCVCREPSGQGSSHVVGRGHVGGPSVRIALRRRRQRVRVLLLVSRRLRTTEVRHLDKRHVSTAAPNGGPTQVCGRWEQDGRRTLEADYSVTAAHELAARADARALYWSGQGMCVCYTLETDIKDARSEGGEEEGGW